MPGGAGTPGGYDSGSGSSYGGGGGEGGAAQRAAAQRAQAQLDADRLNAQRAAEAIARENEARETARENAIQLAALTPKTIEPVRSPHRDTPLQVLEQEILDRDADFLFQDTKAQAPTTLIPKTKTVTYDKGNPFTDQLIPTTVKSTETLFDPRTSQNALLKRPGGIGTLLKNVTLGVLAPQLLAGTKFGTGLDIYNKYQQVKRFLPKGVRKTIQTAFTPNLTTGTKKTTPFVSSGGEGQRVRTVAEQVATGQGLESGAKLLGVDYLRQKEEARRRGKIISEILNKNSYQGKDLTPKQRNDLINYIEQLNKFLVPTVQGA